MTVPDVCDNYLYVYGPTLEVELFMLNHLVVTDDECDAAPDLESIIPYPVRYQRLDDATERWEEEHRGRRSADWSARPDSGYERGGYEWCVRNWGTKWNLWDYGPFACDIDDGRRAYAQVCFPTPNTPVSSRVLLALSRRYPGTTFELRYAEPEYRGRVRTRGGRLLVETRYRRRWTGNVSGPTDMPPRPRRRRARTAAS